MTLENAITDGRKAPFLAAQNFLKSYSAADTERSLAVALDEVVKGSPVLQALRVNLFKSSGLSDLDAAKNLADAVLNHSRAKVKTVTLEEIRRSLSVLFLQCKQLSFKLTEAKGESRAIPLHL